MNTPFESPKIKEALNILEQLDIPKQQRNERSALCLLALVDLKPSDPWSSCRSPLIGITQMMNWMKKHYDKLYAPNSRETIRRQTMHQFIQAGISFYNPDDPSRATNSPKVVYQITPDILKLLQSYGTPKWPMLLLKQQKKRPSLSIKYAKQQYQKLVPLILPFNAKIELSPGPHSRLVKAIIEDFSARFVGNATPVYIGDTSEKFAYYNKELLISLGVLIDTHGKMPDVVLFHKEKNWLFLIESVTSHGSINPKRFVELTELFSGSNAGLIFVTAFPNLIVMKKHLQELAWETEVWIADTPSHLIHFNGDKFLTPFKKK